MFVSQSKKLIFFYKKNQYRYLDSKLLFCCINTLKMYIRVSRYWNQNA
jgi:hypothetical protein